MNPFAISPLINLIGFVLGAALYAMLLFMAARHPVRAFSQNTETTEKLTIDYLLLAAAILGLLWNTGGLVEILYRGFVNSASSPLLIATAYTALGFLPAVIVHSAWHAAGGEGENESNSKTQILTGAAYLLSGVAGVWHFEKAFLFLSAPSISALRILTAGYLMLLVLLFLFAWRQTIERKAVWGTALAVFAVSALHLSQPHETESSWIIELVGHQASLPLALAILYQDFRFAFADVFLKRAFSLLLLTVACAGLYWLATKLILPPTESILLNQPQTIGAIIALMIAAAFIFPTLRRLAVWLVDKIVLRRANYAKLRMEIAQNILTLEPIEAVLTEVSDKLSKALTAEIATVSEFEHQPNASSAPPVLNFTTDTAKITFPTADQPNYQLVLRKFKGGRRLLSDEIEMLADVALQTARRIDVLRVTHERCEQEIREQEFSKLATEAELRALRAQINPHFLFNALTTVGYLIQTTPDKALATLIQLTQLLRGVLRSSSEFMTLGEEIKLIESYLEIEKARFEERLTVEIKVAPELLSIRIPSLILQPLVENAIKHGITPKKAGGTVNIEAVSDKLDLILRVADTGAGIEKKEFERNRAARIGLNNVEQRLRLHYNGASSLAVNSDVGIGTNVTIKIALSGLKTNLAKQKSVEPTTEILTL